MQYLISLATLILLTSSGCKKEDFPEGIPECIESKIKEIAEGETWNPPAKIYSYQYEGQIVYYFPSKCCDIPSTVYDKDCNALCSPDGGITGKGDGKCPDFFSKRVDEKLIWEDKGK